MNSYFHLEKSLLLKIPWALKDFEDFHWKHSLKYYLFTIEMHHYVTKHFNLCDSQSNFILHFLYFISRSSLVKSVM